MKPGCILYKVDNKTAEEAGCEADISMQFALCCPSLTPLIAASLKCAAFWQASRNAGVWVSVGRGVARDPIISVHL